MCANFPKWPGRARAGAGRSGVGSPPAGSASDIMVSARRRADWRRASVSGIVAGAHFAVTWAAGDGDGHPGQRCAGLRGRVAGSAGGRTCGPGGPAGCSRGCPEGGWRRPAARCHSSSRGCRLRVPTGADSWLRSMHGERPRALRAAQSARRAWLRDHCPTGNFRATSWWCTTSPILPGQRHI